MEKMNIQTQASKDSNHLHLYEKEGHWYAYGHSAQLMKRLQNGIGKVKQLANSAQHLVTDCVEIDFNTILEKFTIILCSDNELVVKYPDVN